MCRCARFTTSCHCSSIPHVVTGASVLLRTTIRRPAEDVPTLQEPPSDTSLSVRDDNWRTAELHLAPKAVAHQLPSTIDPEVSPSLETTMHGEFNALPQDAEVAQPRPDSSPLLRRDSRLQKDVFRTLLRFADVVSIRGYGKANLLSHARTFSPGTTSIRHTSVRMKQRPLNPVMEESLWQQVDRRFEQRVVEEKNSREVRWATNYWRMNTIPKEDVSSPDCRSVPQDKGWPICDLGTDDHGSLLFGCSLFSPSSRGHGYRPRNISGRWPEATPQGEKFKWLVTNFHLDSSPLLRREMVKMSLMPALKRNSGEIRWAVHYQKQNAVRKEEAFPFPNIADNLPPLSANRISSALDGADASRFAAKANRSLPLSEMLCYRDHRALHPAGAWYRIHAFARFYPPSGLPDSKPSQEGLNSCRTTSSTWTVRSALRESRVPLRMPRSSGSGPCSTPGRLFASP